MHQTRDIICCLSTEFTSNVQLNSHTTVKMTDSPSVIFYLLAAACYVIYLRRVIHDNGFQ